MSEPLTPEQRAARINICRRPNSESCPVHAPIRADIAAAIRAAEQSAREEQRERDAKMLEREADKYQTADGEEGPLASEWGWRSIAKTYRRIASAIRSGDKT